MLIDLKNYKKNKETNYNARRFADLVFSEFPDKEINYLAMLGLIFSLSAIMAHIRAGEYKKGFLPAVKGTLWAFMNEIREFEKK